MPPRNFTDSEEEQIAKIYLAEHSTRSIARAYGLSHHISIVSALRRQGIKQRSPADRNRLYQLDRHVFDVIDNELAAYHWGFLYADGTVHKRSLRIALAAKDRDQIEKIKYFLKCEHPVKMMIEKLNGNEYGKATLFVTSKYLTDRLRQLGIIKERRNFREHTIEQLPDYLINHWIRGYFDGDGCCLSTVPTISFVGQRELLEWIRQQIADNAGTNPNLKLYEKCPNIYGLTIAGRIQMLNAAKYIYKDATIWMERKREMVNSWK